MIFIGRQRGAGLARNCASVEAYFGLPDDLRGMIDREIDLVMVDAVKNRYVAQNIQRTKQPLYAA